MRRSLYVSLFGILLLAALALGGTIAAGNEPQLGLDLQGGTSLVLKPKLSNVADDQLTEAISIIRSRVDALGVAEPEITRQGKAVVVELPGTSDLERIQELVGKTAELQFRPVLSVTLGKDALAARAEADASSTTTVSGATTTVAGATTTVSGATTTAAATTVAGANTTAAVSAGPGKAKPITQQAATTTPAPTTAVPTSAATATTVATGTTVAGATTTTVPIDLESLLPPLTDPDAITLDATVTLPEYDNDGKETRRYTLGPTTLTGKALKTARAEFTNEWQVSVDFKSGQQGLAGFNEISAHCVAADAICPTQQTGIVLDGVVLSAPVPETANFTDTVSITGGFSKGEARDLATALKYGALPVEFEAQSVQAVSATLGKDSLRAGIVAGIVGVGLVVLFMTLYYRTLGGLVILLGLCVSSSLLWSIVSYLGVHNGLALTLSGAAGIIVSIGVTVDSYVVYFERLKDDVRMGKSLRASAERGFSGAYRTIIAADLVSLLGASVLYLLTVGSVRGFAFFLGLSTMLDMIVAFFFTRPMVIWLSRSARFMRGSVFGVKIGEAAPAPMFAGATGASIPARPKRGGK